eukprot:Tbor_TRINITY_DN5766_c2_g4::TRINITY_DN5766_c2_g4_i2::g.19733::m.19733
MFKRSLPIRIFADKLCPGQIITQDKRYWRVLSNQRSQEGQVSANYNIKVQEVGGIKQKDITASQGFDFTEVKYEKVRLLFSGFDENDYACFVYPEHHANSGKEVNIKGESLSEGLQKFLAVGMPSDLLHIITDDDDSNNNNNNKNEDDDNNNNKDVWTELTI